MAKKVDLTKPLSPEEALDLVKEVANHDFAPSEDLPSMVDMNLIREKMENKEKCPECGDVQELGAIGKTPDGMIHQGRCSVYQEYLKTLPEPVINPKDQAIIDKVRAGNALFEQEMKKVEEITEGLVARGELTAPSMTQEDRNLIFKSLVKVVNDPLFEGVLAKPGIDERIQAAEKVLEFLKKEKEKLQLLV